MPQNATGKPLPQPLPCEGRGGRTATMPQNAATNRGGREAGPMGYIGRSPKLNFGGNPRREAIRRGEAVEQACHRIPQSFRGTGRADEPRMQENAAEDRDACAEWTGSVVGAMAATARTRAIPGEMARDAGIGRDERVASVMVALARNGEGWLGREDSVMSGYGARRDGATRHVRSHVVRCGQLRTRSRR